MSDYTIKELLETNITKEISGQFLVRNTELKPFKQKPGNFFQCELCDKTGTIKAIAWERAEKFKTVFDSFNPAIFEIKGEITKYNDVHQVILSGATRITEFNISDFVPSLDPQRSLNLKKTLQSFKIENEICKKIYDYFNENSPIYQNFCECPGGVGKVHHSYIGGLLEHTVTMMTIADNCSETERLNKDTMVIGCLVHDIGKTAAYNWNPVIEMTDRGRLMHHSILGYGILQDIAAELKIDKDDSDLLRLQHIIISHHEDESIRKPLFPEAAIIAKIDYLDSISNFWKSFMESPENQTDNNWTRFSTLLNRYLYNPKFLEKKS